MAKFPSIWGDLEVRAENIALSVEPQRQAPVGKQERELDDDDTKSPDVEEENDLPNPPASKEEEEEEEEYEFSEDDVSKAYTMLDEEGVLDLDEEDEFEPTPKGIADAVAKTVANKLRKEIESIPPIVQEFYNHIIEGNSATNFVPSTNDATWAEFSIEDDADETAVLEEFFRNQGMSDDDIAEELEELSDPVKKTKRAEKALEVLIKKEESDQGTKAQKAAEDKKNAVKAQQEEIEGLKSLIDTTPEIAGFELDATKRTAFKEYLFKVNPRSGKSQMQENMSSEARRMTIAFLDFVNYTKADLTKEVATQLTKDRKKKLSRYTDKNVANTNSSAVVKTKVNKTTGSIVFPSIFGTQKIEIED